MQIIPPECPRGVANGSRHSKRLTPGSKPANKGMKSKIIPLASHVQKGEEKEESLHFTVYYWMNTIAKIH